MQLKMKEINALAIVWVVGFYIGLRNPSAINYTKLLQFLALKTKLLHQFGE